MVWQMVAPYISGYDCWSQVCPSASCISNNQTSNTNHLFPSNLYFFKILLGFPFTILSNLLDKIKAYGSRCLSHCCFSQNKNSIVCLPTTRMQEFSDFILHEICSFRCNSQLTLSLGRIASCPLHTLCNALLRVKFVGWRFQWGGNFAHLWTND